MKKLGMIAFIVVSAAAAATLDQYVSITVESDSLGLDQGRRQVLWNASIDEDAWGVRLTERYLDADSGGLVPRRFIGRNDLLLDGDARFGILTVSPGVRWNTATGDGLDFVLPLQEGTVFDQSYIRPELGIQAELPHGLRAFVEGSMVERSLEYPDGTPLGWSGQGAEGYLEWDTPGILYLRAGGSFRKHSIADIDFDTDWSQAGIVLGVRPVSIPARVQIMGQAEYSSLNGEDYLGEDLGERITCRMRAVRSFLPGISLNMTAMSVIDRRDGEWYRSVGSGSARLVLTKGMPGSIPNQLVLGGQYTSSSVNTSRFDASARIHLVRGLSALLSADLRDGPTTVAGAGSSRQRVTLGSGLEYRFSSIALVWFRIQQERTELVEVEDWSRLDAGIQFWPPSISL